MQYSSYFQPFWTNWNTLTVPVQIPDEEKNFSFQYNFQKCTGREGLEIH